MSRNIRSINEDKEMMQCTLNQSKRKNAKIFDEITELNRDIHKYKRRLNRAYRPLDINYDRKPTQPSVYDSYSSSRPAGLCHRTPVYNNYSPPSPSQIYYRPPVYDEYKPTPVPLPLPSEVPHRAPYRSSHRSPSPALVYYRPPVYDSYDEDFPIKKRSVPVDPVVQKSYRTKDGILHHIYTVQSAL
ncbi:uncharacterized protein LOC115215725 [Argonauta hians]